MNKKHCVKIIGLLCLILLLALVMTACSFTCPECGGSGDCKNCKGTGYIWNPNGGGAGIGGDEACPKCHTSGDCPKCNGSGLRY